MQKLRIFWADSRGKVIAVLTFLWLVTLLFRFQTIYLLAPIISVVGMFLSDGLTSFAKIRVWRVSLSTVVTALLIGLVFDPTAGIIPIITACFLASLSKNFIGKGPHNHVFNPAAFGIITASLLFNRSVSWWGGAWGLVPVAILAIGMTPVLWKLKRFWMPVGFLAVYFLSNFLSGNLNSAIRLTLDGTIFLFAFVMIPEIKTSPGKGYWQYLWGVLVGGIVFLATRFQISITDPLLFALLFANLIGFFSMRYTFIR